MSPPAPRKWVRRSLNAVIDHLRAHPRRKAFVLRILARSGNLGQRVKLLAHSRDPVLAEDAWEGGESQQSRNERGSGADCAERLAARRRLSYVVELEQRIDALEERLRRLSAEDDTTRVG